MTFPDSYIGVGCTRSKGSRMGCPRSKGLWLGCKRTKGSQVVRSGIMGSLVGCRRTKGPRMGAHDQRGRGCAQSDQRHCGRCSPRTYKPERSPSLPVLEKKRHCHFSAATTRVTINAICRARIRAQMLHLSVRKSFKSVKGIVNQR